MSTSKSGKPEIYGSIVGDDSENDAVDNVIDWLRGLMEAVPSQSRHSTRVSVKSILSYEDHHYAQIEVYYFRPETDAEWSDRQASYARESKARDAEERRQYEALRRKFGG